jgi:lysophospholipase L1-like esterase
MKNKKRVLIILIILLIFVITGVMFTAYIKNEKERCQKYDAFFLSRNGSVNFEEEWYTEKWGIEANIVDTRIDNPLIYTWILDFRLELYENVNTVFIEVPSEISKIERFSDLIAEYPNVTFYVYCVAESIDYWSGLNIEERNDRIGEYNQTYDMLISNDNVIAFEFYNMEWMINNPANYQEDGSLNGEASYSMFVSFARHDNLYEENKSNFLFEVGETRNENQFLKDKEILIFGDSIWARNETSMSIESVVSGIMDATIDNRAVGGSTAGVSDGIPQNFLQVVNEWIDTKEDNPDYILIEYGLNDYFEQEQIENPDQYYDENTYKGALRKGIELLQKEAPEAKIIMLGPSTIQRFNFGEENISGLGTLLDYEFAMKEVADEMSVDMIMNYDVGDLKIENIEEFIELDQVHLNEKGMYLYGKRFVELLK